MVNRCERRIVAESWREAVRKGRRGVGGSGRGVREPNRWVSV